MCGIAAFVSRDARIPISPLVSGLLRQLEHRGPDDQGWFSLCGKVATQGRTVPESMSAEVVLCHRRLSIIDVSAAGSQPMRSPDGRYVISFNGEIYNYLELKAELEGLGVLFRSNSDTEVLLQAFIVWGEKCLLRFVGMFAFVVLDCQERRLFLARDPFGIKPLYYGTWIGGVAFASEIRPLLEFPGISRTADAGQVYEYLLTGFTDSGSRTFFAEIQQLPAGSWMEVGVDEGVPTRFGKYWQPRIQLTPHEISSSDAADRLREMFLDSVRLHLRSDVPVGAALSGGVDSSAIVSAIRRVQGPNLLIHTFTYGDGNPALNEEKWARLVGGSVSAQSHIIRIASGGMQADLRNLVRVQEQPFGSTSIFAQYCVFREARRQGIKVMLDGQGADEIFAGYRSFFAPRLVSLLRQMRLGAAFAFALRAMEVPNLGLGDLLTHTGAFLLPNRIREAMLKLAGRYRTPPWLNEGWFREREAVRHSVPRYALKGSRLLTECLAASATIDSLPFLLRYEDRNSMAFSIESRVPFLTTKLVDFAYSLPEEYLIDSDGSTKSVLRAALRGIVPQPILDRRDKVGFATSEFEWLKENRGWIKGLFGSEEWRRRLPVLDHDAVADEFREVLDGNGRFDSRLWRMINLRIWVEEFDVEFSQSDV